MFLSHVFNYQDFFAAHLTGLGQIVGFVITAA
jgi:hypothetical protein